MEFSFNKNAIVRIKLHTSSDTPGNDFATIKPETFSSFNIVISLIKHTNAQHNHFPFLFTFSKLI